MAIKKSIKSKARSKPRHRICLQISGVDEQIKAGFIGFSRTNKLTYHETFSKMWQSFKFLPDTQNEIALIEEASKITGESFKQAMTNAIMAVVRHIIAKDRAKNAELPQTVAANTRIANIVSEMIEQNTKAKYWYDRKFINQSSVAKYMERLKFQSESYVAVSVTTIKRYFEANRALLDAHHAKYNLDEEHNRKASNYLKVNSHKDGLLKDDSDNHRNNVVHANEDKKEKTINKSLLVEDEPKKVAKHKVPAKQKMEQIAEHEQQKAIKSRPKAQPEAPLQIKATKQKNEEKAQAAGKTLAIEPKDANKQKMAQVAEHEGAKVLKPQTQPELEEKQLDTASIASHKRSRGGKLSKKAKKLAKQARKAGRK